MSDLLARGFDLVAEEDADVIVVNTCGFIAEACAESVDTILSMAEHREKGCLKALVVAGCLAERYREDLERELDEADAVVGLADRDRIGALCLHLLGIEDRDTGVTSRVVTGPLYTSYLRIAEGCDNRCTYCMIPLIRGPFRSVPSGRVLREAEELVRLGARELVLIAQDTTCYGKDGGSGSLAALLEGLDRIDDLMWIRLMYTHPDRFTEPLIDAIAGLPKVIPYLDIPLQHIAAPVLTRMGRKGSPDRIRALLGRLRERIDGLVIRTALIVGFPGETEGDFEELLDFVKETRFERLGAFVYSAEEGTPASRFGGVIDEETASERHSVLMTAQAGISEDFHASLVGRDFTMIVDKIDGDTGAVRGRTYMDAPEVDCVVTVPGGVNPSAAFARVRITATGAYDLEAEVI